MGVGDPGYATGALPPKKTRYPLYRRLGGCPRAGLERWWIPCPTGIRSPDRPARSESLYQLSYPGPHICIQCRAKGSVEIKQSRPFALITWSVFKQIDNPCLHAFHTPSINLTVWTSRVWDNPNFTQYSPFVNCDSCPVKNSLHQTERPSVTTLHFINSQKCLYTSNATNYTGQQSLTFFCSTRKNI
jgi:hypothetical protein